eukprot:INCI14192.1.p1 GENE.INCI14192.1~~INCI14192.1.p1  ORF type:complete len:414 (+),score=56.12 INCI14192.1:327-1568(+)
MNKRERVVHRRKQTPRWRLSRLLRAATAGCLALDVPASDGLHYWPHDGHTRNWAERNGNNVLDQSASFRFAEHQQRLREGSTERVESRVGATAGARSDFPDNGACKRGGMMPGSRDQAGLESTCCCQVCPAQFLVELQLLELSSDVAYETYLNFDRWNRARQGLQGPVPVPAAASFATEPSISQESASTHGDRYTAFLEAETAIATLVGAHSTFGPSKAMDMNMVVEAGPCCPLCPSSFMPQRADAVSKPLVFLQDTSATQEPQRGSNQQHDAAGAYSSLRRHTGRGSTFNIADEATGSTSRKKQTKSVGVRVASFVQTSDGQGGVFNDNAAMSKSRSDRTGEGNPVCCNVCVAQESVPQAYADVMTHPDQMAKTGDAMGNKFSNKVVGVGKRDSCCVLCRGNHDTFVLSLLE